MQLASEWKFDEAAIGLILIAYMLPAIASGAVSGWLCDRYGTKIVALVSLTLVTPACVAIGIPNRNTPFWPLVLLLAVGGMTMAGCQSPIFPEIASVVARENERHKGKKRDGLATSYALFNAAYGAGKLAFTHIMRECSPSFFFHRHELWPYIGWILVRHRGILLVMLYFGNDVCCVYSFCICVHWSGSTTIIQD